MRQQSRERISSLEYKVTGRIMKRLVLIGVVGTLLTVAYASPTIGQVMVCQTQTFWCSFPGAGPSGVPCYCNTFWGPISGLSINPYANKPMPQGPNPRNKDPEPDPDHEIDLGKQGNDCLNGLGNCSGSFRSYQQRPPR